MNPLNITLPPDVFQKIASGEKTFVSTKRNPRKDRYFFSKSPDKAKINGQLFNIFKIVIDDYVIHVYIS